MTKCTMSSQRRAQVGLTMIESLVAIVLTLALTAGLMQMLLGTQINIRNQNDRSSMDDDARFAVEYLSRAGQRAGFKRDPNSTDEQVFAEVPGSFPLGGLVFGTDTSLSLRYEGHNDKQLVNCHNLPADQGGVYVEVWSIDPSNSALSCNLSRPNGTVNTASLLNNVEAINIQYGLDTNNDEFPDTYVAAAAVGSNWINVRSVVVGMRIVSNNNNLSEQPQPYVDFTGNTLTPNDRRLRRNVFTTIALRNHLP